MKFLAASTNVAAPQFDVRKASDIAGSIANGKGSGFESTALAAVDERVFTRICAVPDARMGHIRAQASKAVHAVLGIFALTVVATAAHANGPAIAAGKAFADHCFNPRLTAETAQANIAPSGGRLDFYDLRPFSSVAAAPVTGRPATPGTDRRCEVAFDGFDPQNAIVWLTTGLTQEGLADKKAAIPADFPRQNGTVFIGAAQLNPKRVAVVQAGVRSGPNGPETFMNVERLAPADEVSR